MYKTIILLNRLPSIGTFRRREYQGSLILESFLIAIGIADTSNQKQD